MVATQPTLKSTTTIDELAAALGVSRKQLTYWAYIVDDSKKYTAFSIKKRSGGVREINAPFAELKLMQRRANELLSELYYPNKAVHGFCRHRSILSNASFHVRKRFVLNVDLKDFFPTINFGRVRGMLIAKPYSLRPAIATVIAQLCCLNNSLPQGAPTSPLLANMICARMDRELVKLAKKHGCRFTRYCDDLTFSTAKREFPAALGKLLGPTYNTRAEVGFELQNVITSNGFSVNVAKVRLYSSKRRQEVTGLTVNKFPNVQRTYIRKLRAMLHAWSKYGEEAAEAEYLAKYSLRHRHPARKPPVFRFVVKGKLSYLRMVRGYSDPAYQNLSRRAQLLDAVFFKEIPKPIDKIDESLWVIEDDEDATQGTAFALGGVGLITCAHVLGKKPVVFQASNIDEKYPAKILSRNDDIDLAILSIEKELPSVLQMADPSKLNMHDDVLLTGFPQFSKIHAQPYKEWGQVTTFLNASGIRRFLISSTIVAGASGSPVFDKRLRVIGVAVTGSDSFEDAATNPTEKHGVIPISALQHLT